MAWDRAVGCEGPETLGCAVAAAEVVMSTASVMVSATPASRRGTAAPILIPPIIDTSVSRTAFSRTDGGQRRSGDRGWPGVRG